LSTKEGFQTCPSRWRLEITTDLEALVVAAYVFADEYPVPARCGSLPSHSTGSAKGGSLLSSTG
jgi:hypothetical protein